MPAFLIKFHHKMEVCVNEELILKVILDNMMSFLALFTFCNVHAFALVTVKYTISNMW